MLTGIAKQWPVDEDDVFDAIDSDGDGYVQAKELARMYRGMAELTTKCAARWRARPIRRAAATLPTPAPTPIELPPGECPARGGPSILQVRGDGACNRL